MNGYDLTRNWYNFKFENPDKVRHIHSDMYFYIVDLWNRLGQTKKIGLPTSITMQSMRIGSYNTYKNVVQDLIDFGFITLISDAKNQYQSKVIALSKNDKASDEALDKALVEATDESTDSIIEQNNNIKDIRVYRKFKHLSLYQSEFDKLKNDFLYSKEEIDEKLDAIQNAKNNKKYESLYLTCLNWLRKQYGKREKPTQGIEVPMTDEEYEEYIRPKANRN